MMAAAQPFISGAISKTVNQPADATVEDVENAYLEAWKAGLKAIAVYRDGCKRTQPVTTSKTDPGLAARRRPPRPSRCVRRKLPDERRSLTHKFSVGGHEGYIHVGLYDSGEPGEIFIRMAKEGSTISGLMDSFATAVSLALQHGVPLRLLVDKFSRMRFEPSGFTGNPEIPRATSVMDYLFRWLGAKFLRPENEAEARKRRSPPSRPPRRPGPRGHRAQPRRGGRPNGPGRGQARGARDVQLPGPHRCADLPRVRLDHGAQRQLPQVHQLRNHQRL